ncbi:MAG: cytochrome c peroxidase [Hyphomicrobium sp.]|nr:cytochrome c peroxidase [Hyphomicrobium sp.]
MSREVARTLAGPVRPVVQTASALVIRVVALVAVALLASVACRADDGRDALWRSIFARPADASPDRAGREADPRAGLGARLFRDPRLSGATTRSCASCHQPELGFTDGLPKGAGLDGTLLKRNTPTLLNARWGTSFYWDGRMPTLEAQARVPILAPNELGGDFATVVARFDADAEMRRGFATAFPDAPDVSEANILAALAAYERTLVSPRTRFDAWVDGDDGALNSEERQGFAIFVGKGGCVSCHGGWRFTDDAFHDIGLESSDPGRGGVDPTISGLPAFKTPTLRELARTAPYMHDGSLSTLDDVVSHYAGKVRFRASLSPNIVRGLKLDARERAALVAFLGTLSSGESIGPESAPSSATR